MDISCNYLEWKNYESQDWAVENASIETYRDGTLIPQITDATEWSNLTTGAWCYFDNDPNKGVFYNWYAVIGVHEAASLSNLTLRKEFAPEGWHVPSDAEWTTLKNYLIANGYNYDDTTLGDKIAKAMSSTTGWDIKTNQGSIGNDQSLNNRSGFNAFPEGFRTNDGSFYNESVSAIFWSSSESSGNAWYRSLHANYSDLNRFYNNLQYGLSVRVVRD